MVELSIEVIEGLRDPLIGLRCWISRCTWQSLLNWQLLKDFMNS